MPISIVRRVHFFHLQLFWWKARVGRSSQAFDTSYVIHKGFELKVISGKGLFSCEPKWGLYAINCVKAFGPCESVSVEKGDAKKRAHKLYNLYPT